MKEKVKEMKRDFIIEVAKGLFFEKGYENTSIDEVAKSAGISKSTLYTYVKGKEDLFISIHYNGMKLRVEQLKIEMNSKTTGYDKIYAFGEVYYNFYKQNPGYFKLHMFEDYNSINKEKVKTFIYQEFDNLLNEVISLVRSAFESGIQDGSLKNDLNIEYCDKYFAYTLRIILNVAFSPEKTKHIIDKYDEERFYFQYLDLFMTAIKNTK
jgi:AcrR family transcriptional regulator